MGPRGATKTRLDTRTPALSFLFNSQAENPKPPSLPRDPEAAKALGLPSAYDPRYKARCPHPGAVILPSSNLTATVLWLNSRDDDPAPSILTPLLDQSGGRHGP